MNIYIVHRGEVVAVQYSKMCTVQQKQGTLHSMFIFKRSTESALCGETFEDNLFRESQYLFTFTRV